MPNRLQHLAEFQTILAHYHISPAGRQILADVKLALLVGVSGSGRDTIIRELLKTGTFEYLISDTTRQPRHNDGVLEQNGREYWFRTEEEFLADLKAGKYLEAEIMHGQQVSGISIRELSRAMAHHKVAIRNVDLNIRNIVEAKPDLAAFLVVPPNFKEWMSRLDGRGHMPPLEKRRRLETAAKIFAAGLEWPFFTLVVNDELANAVAHIHDRVTTGVADREQQIRARQVIEELLKETRMYLAD